MQTKASISRLLWCSAATAACLGMTLPQALANPLATMQSQPTPRPRPAPRPAPNIPPAQPAPAPQDQMPSDTAPGNPQPTPNTPSSPSSPSHGTGTTTTLPAAGDTTKKIDIGPYIKFTHTKDHNLTARVRVFRGNMTEIYYDAINEKSAAITKTLDFEPMNTIAVVWPVLTDTGSSVSNPRDVTGRLKINDRVMATEPKLLRGYQGGVQLARFDAVPTDGTEFLCKQVELEVYVPVSSSRTEFDEVAAQKVPWPTAWPNELEQWLQPQLYVETGFNEKNLIAPYKDDLVTEALAQVLREARVTEAKAIPPARLAKLLTQHVWKTVQINRGTIGRDGRSGELPGARMDSVRGVTTGEFGGVVILSPQTLLEFRKGTNYDATVLLVALMKKAGLPARPVIGYDRNAGGGAATDKLYSGSGKGSKALRVWAEFALYDETAKTLNWVPVDIARLHKASSRPLAIDRTWKFFGTNDELEEVVPFSFHFHPPTDVVSYGAPAFWGWFVTPQPPQTAGQTLVFTAVGQSKRAEDMPGTANTPGKKTEEKDEKKKRGGY